MRSLRYLFTFSFAICVSMAAQALAQANPPEANTLVPATITFVTNPPGLSVIVDGTSHTTPYQTSWTRGTNHTINTTSPQAGSTGIQYVFGSWSDGGAQSHTVTAPRNDRTYTATFSTEYYLTMASSPTNGGTVTPSSGWRSNGQTVSINATANSGYTFGGWTGSGTGSYTGATKSTSITMSGPITQRANFSQSTQPVLSVTPADRPVSADAGTTSFAVSNTGTGTMNWTASSDQSWATITGGSSGTNNGTVSISFSANPSSSDARQASITVTASGANGSPKTVTVSQAAALPPVLIRDTTSVSDDFNGATLDGALWTTIDPRGDAAFSMGNDQLSIEVSGGLRHEPWTSGNTAPRVLQTVSPSMNLNVWTVKFNSLPSGSSTTIPMQGMFFEQDSLNYVRTDIFSDGVNVYVFAAGFLDGPTSPTVYFTVPIPAIAPPIWLQVTRQGAQWMVYCSIDGVTGITAGGFSHIMATHRVGVFAGNAGTIPAPFTCLVDYFQGALPAMPTLRNPESGATGVASPVVFVWDTAAGATTYRFQVSTDPGFSAGLLDTMVAGTSCTVANLQPSLQYFWRVAGRNNIGWGDFSGSRSFSVLTTGVSEDGDVPEAYGLEQNYPNPFNPTTRIRYFVPKQSGRAGQMSAVTGVRLVVYDLLGREVAILVNEPHQAGSYEVSFNGSGLASGVYVYRLTAGSFIQNRAMILVR